MGFPLLECLVQPRFPGAGSFRAPSVSIRSAVPVRHIHKAGMNSDFSETDPERLKAQADLCRRASAITRDPALAARLLAMAETYLAEARTLSRAR